jgi:hypothetical protein
MNSNNIDIQDILEESARIEVQALEAYQEKRKALEKYNKQQKIEREKNPELNRLVRYWYTEKVVLYVETRKCIACGCVSEMPNPELMVKRINYKQGITNITTRHISSIPSQLQREILYHEGPGTRSCTQCYKGLANTKQLDLFSAEYVVEAREELEAYSKPTVETHYGIEEL